MKFHMPPRQQNENGELRKVGFELEFTGIELPHVADKIIELYGGEPVRESGFLHRVSGTQYGDFTIEVDATLLKDKIYEKYLNKLGIDISDLGDADNLEDLFTKIASTVVPLELSAPPLPLSHLDEIEKIRSMLQKSNALGTEASLLYAFGMHINPETPATDTQTVLRFLRAFLLLYIWIFKKSAIDFSRRLTPFIDEFPEAYTRLVLDPRYQPNTDTLFADYLAHNPTRNRPLDMLPLFAHLDEKMRDRLTGEIVKPRPAFHYRLPNCLLDDPHWTVAREWNYWVAIEKLADNPDDIRKLSKAYLEMVDSTFFSFKNKWFEYLDKWLKNL